MWSRAPAWGYYDHPPMVAWLIALGAALAGDGALGIRLLAPVSACVGSILLSWALDRAYPATRPGIAASVLLNATLAFGAGAVTMTPDTPLLLFWTLAMAALLPVAATGRGWLGAGLAAGAALLSKYTALLFGVSVAVWLALVPPMRRWLIDLRPLAAACLAITLFVPVLWWNARHGWVSFAKQGGRIADFDPARAVRFTGELIAGQIGLATPGIAVLMTVGTVAAARRRDPVGGLLAALTVVPALVFAEHALGDRVQANWPAITYPSAAAAAAILGKPWARLRPAAAALGFAITGAVYLQAVAALPLPRRLDPTLIRLGGWRELAAAVAARARTERASFVVSDSYGDAALLARLLPADIPVVGADQRWAVFALPDAAPLIAGRDGLLLRSGRRSDPPDASDWAQMQPVGEVSRARGAIVAETYRLYRVVGGRPTPPLPVVVLPRPRSDACLLC